MSFKYGKSVGSALYQKSVYTKAVRHFEENNYKGDDLHADRNKID